jgi:hypothetical protein
LLTLYLGHLTVSSLELSPGFGAFLFLVNHALSMLGVPYEFRQHTGPAAGKAIRRAGERRRKEREQEKEKEDGGDHGCA